MVKKFKPTGNKVPNKTVVEYKIRVRPNSVALNILGCKTRILMNPIKIPEYDINVFQKPCFLIEPISCFLLY